LLTASRHNGCSYCVAAYSALAAAAKVDPAVIDAVREDKQIDDPQLEAVRRFTGLVVDNRGWVADGDVKAFMDAGFTRRQVLDILTGVAMKTMPTTPTTWRTLRSTRLGRRTHGRGGQSVR
jgi:alkylhydroperoxidase family enzyme